MKNLTKKGSVFGYLNKNDCFMGILGFISFALVLLIGTGISALIVRFTENKFWDCFVISNTILLLPYFIRIIIEFAQDDNCKTKINASYDAVIFVLDATIYFIWFIPFIIAKFISVKDNTDFFDNCVVGFFIELAFIPAIIIIAFLYILLRSAINSLRIYKRATYLPITVEELKENDIDSPYKLDEFLKNELFSGLNKKNIFSLFEIHFNLKTSYLNTLRLYKIDSCFLDKKILKDTEKYNELLDIIASDLAFNLIYWLQNDSDCKTVDNIINIRVKNAMEKIKK